MKNVVGFIFSLGKAPAPFARRGDVPSMMAVPGKDPLCPRTSCVPPQAPGRRPQPTPTPGRSPHASPRSTPLKASCAAVRIRNEAGATGGKRGGHITSKTQNRKSAQTRKQAEARGGRAGQPDSRAPSRPHSQGVQQELGGPLEGEPLPLLERLPALPLIAQVQRGHRGRRGRGGRRRRRREQLRRRLP